MGSSMQSIRDDGESLRELLEKHGFSRQEITYFGIDLYSDQARILEEGSKGGMNKDDIIATLIRRPHIIAAEREVEKYFEDRKLWRQLKEKFGE